MLASFLPRAKRRRIVARREAHKRMTAEEQARYSAAAERRTYTSTEGTRAAAGKRMSSNRAARHAGTPQHAASRAEGAADQYARQRTTQQRSGIGKKILIALLILYFRKRKQPA